MTWADSTLPRLAAAINIILCQGPDVTGFARESICLTDSWLLSSTAMLSRAGFRSDGDCSSEASSTPSDSSYICADDATVAVNASDDSARNVIRKQKRFIVVWTNWLTIYEYCINFQFWKFELWFSYGLEKILAWQYYITFVIVDYLLLDNVTVCLAKERICISAIDSD